MEFKYASWIVLSVGVSINVFGLFWFIAILIGLIGFLIGFLTVLYLQHGDLDKFLDSGLLENPLDEPKTLGLSIVCDQKPSSMLIISPNIKVQTESRKSRLLASSSSEHGKRRNLLDAGIELLFKKRTTEGTSPSGGTGSNGSSGSSQAKSGTGLITDHLMHKGHLHFHQKDNKILDNTPPTGTTSLLGKQPSPGEDKSNRWRPFDNIKIHTDKGKTIQLQQQPPQDGADRQPRKKDEPTQIEMANVNLASVVLRNALRQKMGVRFSSDLITQKIGKREVVGHGWNGLPVYADRVDYPMPAIRFKEVTPDVQALREKEKGDWKKLSVQEKKALYRASFCQTFAEIKYPTGEWKMHIGLGLIVMSMSIVTMLLMKAFVYDELPVTFDEEHQKAQLKRMLDLGVNPITGLSSKWDYDNNKWK